MPPSPAYNWLCVLHTTTKILSNIARHKAAQVAPGYVATANERRKHRRVQVPSQALGGGNGHGGDAGSTLNPVAAADGGTARQRGEKAIALERPAITTSQATSDTPFVPETHPAAETHIHAQVLNAQEKTFRSTEPDPVLLPQSNLEPVSPSPSRLLYFLETNAIM